MVNPTSTLLTRVDRFVQSERLLDAGEPVVVGLSGGVDSIVLAHGLQRLGYKSVAAHVNYGLRDDASDADEAFVRAWCAEQDPSIAVRVKLVQTAEQAREEGRSVQALARDQRYAFFEAVAREEGITNVAVAHHRDDQAETLLLNLFRGSGLEGLQGMQPQRPLQKGSSIQLIRPLLTASRAEIEAYAEANDLSWRTDASNASLEYRRGAVRHAVLPVINEHFEGATERIAHTAETLQQYVVHTFRPELEDRFNDCAVPVETSGGLLGLEALAGQPPVWRQRIILEALRQWLPEAPEQAAFVEEIDALRSAQVGRQVECRSGRIWRERNGLRFVPSSAQMALPQPHAVPWDEPVALPQGTVRVERLEDVPDAFETASKNVVFADADELSAPLKIRPWRAGDRFQPLGMAGQKKISDFLTDEKVPPHRRNRVLVLCAGERIVWVVGHRLAHPFRVRPDTRRAAQLTFQPTST